MSRTTLRDEQGKHHERTLLAGHLRLVGDRDAREAAREAREDLAPISDQTAAGDLVALADRIIADHPSVGRRLLYMAADLFTASGMPDAAEACIATAKGVKRLLSAPRRRPWLVTCA